MHAEALVVVRGPLTMTAESCPRCGSAEIHRLALIHQAGLPTTARDGLRALTALSRHAAPPVRKRAGMWTLLLVTSLVMEVATFTSGGAGAAAIAGVALTAAIFAVRATSYNANTYPKLLELWERSFMCGRCGEVFSTRMSG
jgi:predicted RNA-binding Zn-ribbon protein involved in translation (DUF1610 family)